MDITEIKELTPDQESSLSAIDVKSGSAYLLLYDPDAIPKDLAYSIVRWLSESTGRSCAFCPNGIRLLRVDDIEKKD